MIDAAFYAGAADVVVTTGSGTPDGNGRAYAADLVVAVGFSVAALALALRGASAGPELGSANNRPYRCPPGSG